MNKTNIFKRLIVAAVVVMCGITAQAQIEQAISFNLSLPTGDFNDNVDLSNLGPTAGKFSPMSREYIGTNATVGIGGSYRIGYIFDVGFGEVTPYAEGSFLWNQIRKKERNLYDDNHQARKPQYFNIPILLGVNYRYHLTEIITVFGEFGLGYDIFIAGSEGWKNRTGDPYFNYKCKGALAWQIGVGSFFGKYVTVGIHYYGLGNHIIEYGSGSSDPNAYLGPNPEGMAINPDPAHQYYSHPQDKEKTVKRSLGSLMLKIGFHF